MPAPSHALYPIDECPDLMADAYIGDESGNLVFLSVWGRDTATQAFLARLTLGPAESGLEQFHLQTGGGALQVFVGQVDRLQKCSGRSFRRTLFGSLVHLWLFDQRCVKPDQANASALALLPRGHDHEIDRLWRLVRDTCPLPLLDHWRDTVLGELRDRHMLNRLPTALGPLDGYRLAIDVPAITQALGKLIRQQDLAASPSLPESRTSLRRAA
ncbi:hypothetical protein DIE11_17505 [Burkholderia sp. Bp9012]|uniref:hypothetical protein n=1 Tax=Burkholderia sp. Bp9012 TaxID=2184562 RepID=UPI000F59BCF1|nr:hypothetical protein [Burkholderia sp. Bp9012]RQR79190.1 hypothetical protein DIE11_17505 [Burkholderia sp. Bp9012]